MLKHIYTSTAQIQTHSQHSQTRGTLSLIFVSTALLSRKKARFSECCIRAIIVPHVHVHNLQSCTCKIKCFCTCERVMMAHMHTLALSGNKLHMTY
eukprot:sb/3479128/